MNQNELLYQIGLTLVPGIGPVQAKLLVDHFGDASSIFKAKTKELTKLEGIGTIRATNIKNFEDFSAIEEELAFIEKYKIKPLFLKDDDYPRRLLYCYDPPTILYFRGNVSLNAEKIIAIVGTRNNTDYGRTITEGLVKDLTNNNILVISGLAAGIDTICHATCLKNKIPTVAVLGHGLDKIYPVENKFIARQMVNCGGLMTEFPRKTKPMKYNFPSRNRIVAGMSDAIVVVETDIKGGSMITAEIANSYNREVFAFPGRIDHKESAGCNYLIRNNKAILLSHTQQLIDAMRW